MSGKIRILPQEVVVLIAAGEVVERPAACIKEMVENSLDAGASAITVAIQGGGMDSIRVTDNGQGIAEEDLRLVFHPHATSKLHSAMDLQQLGTLGFRGEALASIARVSKVSLATRRRGSPEGYKALNEGGQMISIQPAASAEGTSIQVQDLFYNAPVRRDFLSKPQKEAQLCGELIQQLLLSRPDVAFRFVSDGKQLLASPGDGQLQSALLAVYGLEQVRGLIPVSGSGQGLLLSGYVGVGEQARGNRSHQHFFVNGRAIKSQALSRALEEACRHRVMVQRYPLCALNLTLPHGLVDVNVHPNKWEVRLAKEAQVIASFSAILQEALQTQPLSSPPPLFEQAPDPAPPPSQVSRVEVISQASAQPSDAPQRAALVARDVALELQAEAVLAKEVPPVVQQAAAQEISPKHQETAAQEHLPGLMQKAQHLHIIGTAFDTYILAQQGERLLLIDQHALHERLNFDRMMARDPGQPQSQALLLPQVIELDYPSHTAFTAYRQVLSGVGFEAEDFGQRSVRLLAVPMELGQPLAARSFQDALDQLQQGRLSQGEARERIIIAACKGAIKGGQRLPQSLLQNLVDQMQEQGIIPSCPHGRPILLELTKAELEKRFGRIQA